jgi:hypothetical protein
MILGATITGSLILNGVNLASITGSETSINALNSFTASAATTGSNVFKSNQTVTGSVDITGSLTVVGPITGTVTTASYVLNAVSASYAANATTASYALVSTSASFALNATSASYALNATTASYALIATSASYSNNSTSASYAANSDLLDGRDSLTFATTGSNAFVGTQNINGSVAITGSLTTTGAITAQTLNVQQVTSSIVYSSGSNVFGNSLSNTQSMTGSVGITGSLSVNGNITGSIIKVNELINVSDSTTNVTTFGSIGYNGTIGNFWRTKAGTFADFAFIRESGAYVLRNAVGTDNLYAAGDLNITGALNGTSATFSGALTAVNISNNGIYYGRANASFPATSLGYFALKTNNLDGERGGLTVQVSNSTSTFIDALTINYTGAATFTSSVTVGTDIVLSAANPFVYGGTSVGAVGISNISGSSYMKIYAASHATLANLTQFVNNGSTSLTIASTGAATFSSSVTAAGATFSGTTAVASAAGTSQMRIDRSGTVARIQNYDTGQAANISLAHDGGNVGIGTTSPSKILTVRHGDAGGVRVEYSGNTDNLLIDASSIQAFANTTPSALKLQVSGGNVLIGTTTDSGYKLDVTGEFRATGAATIGGNIQTKTQKLINNAGNFAAMVHKVQGASGTFSSCVITCNLGGAGGWGYIINGGGTGLGMFQSGGGYVNGSANFTHGTVIGGGFTVTCDSGTNIIRFTSSYYPGVHPFISIQMFSSLQQTTFSDSDITITFS